MNASDYDNLEKYDALKSYKYIHVCQILDNT